MTILRKVNFWLILVLILAALLRVYRLADYLQFLGDQGRDVLVVKQMLVEHHFTLLGPNASVGGFFTGPIYYYFMAPFLWLARLSPAGPAYLSAIFGVGLVYLIFKFTQEYVGTKAALIAAIVAALNPKLVDTSRFSWNPNPVPFFALLTMILIYRASKSDKSHFFFWEGVCLGVLYQLHYMTVPFIGIALFVSLATVPRQRWIKLIFLNALGGIVGVLPFLAFEVRHGFPNTKSVIEFVTRGGQTVSPRSSNFLLLIIEILRRIYEAIFRFSGKTLVVLLYGSLMALGIYIVKSLRNPSAENKVRLIILLCWIFIGAFGIGLYRGDLHDHYFAYMFPLPFILLGIAWSLVGKKLWTKLLFGSLCVILIALEMKYLYFWQPPNHQLDQTRTVASIVLTMAENRPYNLALVSTSNSDYAYRYYLDLYHKSPVIIENPEVDPQRKTVTQQLYVICEQKNCQLLGNSLWEIAGFGRAEVVRDEAGPAGIHVYKLIHYTGSKAGTL